MCRRKMDVCGSKAKASICDPALRTVNTAAECGADDDWYYYSPWRSPGSAGIFDSCGMAGGTPKKGEFLAAVKELVTLLGYTPNHGVSQSMVTEYIFRNSNPGLVGPT